MRESFVLFLSVIYKVKLIKICMMEACMEKSKKQQAFSAHMKNRQKIPVRNVEFRFIREKLFSINKNLESIYCGDYFVIKFVCFPNDNDNIYSNLCPDDKYECGVFILSGTVLFFTGYPRNCWVG